MTFIDIQESALAILAFGYLPGVFLAGRWLAINILKLNLASLNPASRLGLYFCVGAASSIIPLFLLALAGLYLPSGIGAAGWLAALFQARKLRVSQLHQPSAGLLGLALTLFVFYGLFCSESIQTGRDQGAYSLHATNIANTHSLLLPLPFEGFEEQRHKYQALLHSSNPLGFNYDFEASGMKGQFPPALALHLAQCYAIGGYAGLILFVPFLAAINFLVAYSLARQFAARHWALLGALFFALNPAQLWNARITLSEILAQSIILTGLLLCHLGIRDRINRNYVVGIAAIAASCLVRIDCFLFATILAVLHLASVILSNSSEQSPDSSTKMRASIAAYVIFGIGWIYYSISTPNYFQEFVPIVSKFLLAGAAAIAAAALLDHPKLKGKLQLDRLLGNKPAWIACSVAVLALVLYCIFLRPFNEPFAMFEEAHYGDRNFRENSVIDLAEYISYPVIGFAVLGFCFALRQILIKRKLELLPLLLAWAAFSLAYLYDPRISPDHIWRIRRFTPIVIPGFLLFAVYGLASVRLPRRPARALNYAAWALAALFLAFANKPIAFLTQYEGTIEITRALQAAIPNDALVLTDLTRLFYGPLLDGKGRQLVRGDLSNKNHLALFNEIGKQAAEDGQSVYLLTNAKAISEFSDFKTLSFQKTWYSLRAANRAPATVIRERTNAFHLAKIDGPIRPFSGKETSLTFGANKIVGIEETGMYGQERTGKGSPFRWSQQTASFTLPTAFESRFTSGRLKLYSSFVDQAPTQIRVNGHLVFDSEIPKKGGDFEFSIPPEIDQSETIKLQIQSQADQPSRVYPNSTDSRELALQIGGITLSTEEGIAFGTIDFGIQPNLDILEGGLYPPEAEGDEIRRWTDGQAVFQIPLRKSFTPKVLYIDIVKSVLSKNDVAIVWNGQSIFRGTVGSEGETLKIPLVPSLGRGPVKLEIVSQTASPQALRINEDTRELGLRLASLKIDGD
ncbi:hypothetical protein [Pelagicoccus sp. SDUM812002]|uniref:hypothetical protein n=1 Tax=Pelagicoccus sp. SDUM812002 TaxID=3041266 RepID=UPI00281039EE|nr:hypothetical protein [Pelagicoccus sp. SDUM812002]MDQ8186381.1 hypothetical protein [Pelagicoccus sp. SDUM812002]